MTKYPDINPLSNPIPSAISNSVVVDLLSSKEIKPWRPTLLIASAIKAPTTGSLPADIFATCLISSISSIGLAYSVIWRTTNCVAFSIPRF